MQAQFGAFTASELFCPKCQSSQPVREKLLLVLPSGELHEFVCSRCATSVGKRTVSGPLVKSAAQTGSALPDRERARPPQRHLPFHGVARRKP